MGNILAKIADKLLRPKYAQGYADQYPANLQGPGYGQPYSAAGYPQYPDRYDDRSGYGMNGGYGPYPGGHQGGMGSGGGRHGCC